MNKTISAFLGIFILLSCMPYSETEKAKTVIGSIESLDSSLNTYQEFSDYVASLDGFLADSRLDSSNYEVLVKVLDDFNIPVAPLEEIDSLACLFHHAKVLMDSIIVIDTHCDFLEVAYYHRESGYSIDERQSRCQMSVEKMKQGHMSAQYLALWLNPGGDQKDSARVAAAPEKLWPFIEFTERHLAEHSDVCGLARNVDEILALKAQGKKAFLLGLENGFFAGSDLAVVKRLADKGITYVTLSHYRDNQLCNSSNYSEDISKGLTEYGKEFIAEMNRQGIVIDISHTSYGTWKEVIELSKAPVVFTHSGAETIWKNPRNVDDETLKLLAKKGGVIQIYLVKNFMGPGRGENVSIKDMVEHLDYCVKLIGIDHVGVGLDFDGGGGANGLNGANDAINLTMELLKLGYSDRDIEKIWGKNFLRVLTEVQRLAE